MINIVDLTVEKFKFNGIKYFKNFISVVSGDNVAIVNVYDSNLVLHKYVSYDQYSVNGQTYGSAEALQENLLLVLYTRFSYLEIQSYQTVSDLPTSPLPDEGTSVNVVNDPTASNNGGWSVYDGAWVQNTLLHDGEVEENETKSVTGDKIFKYIKERIDQTDAEGNLYYFTDSNGAILGYIDAEGKWNIDISGTAKIDIKTLEGVTFAITDNEDKVLFLVDEQGNIKTNSQIKENTINDQIYYPFNSSLGNPTVQSFQFVGECSFSTTAKGRESTLGADDRPEIPLTTGGLAHPKIIYIPSGWNGYRYWMAVTPIFGIISQQPDSASFENPHILCSNDGLVWIEPNGIINPLDQPEPNDVGTNAYWSDTHLELGDDGYFHLYYRGSAFSQNYFGDNIRHSKSIVHRKSKNGVNWSERKLMYSEETNNNVDSDSALLSPVFINNGSYWHCFDCVRTSASNPIPSQKNQEETFVFHRIDKDYDGNFGEYEQSDIVNFTSKPWGNGKDIWHLDGIKWGNTWWLLLNIGTTGGNSGTDLYLAHSGDGWNFDVVQNPLFTGNSYRSSIVGVEATEESIEFNIWKNQTLDGGIGLYKLKLKYS